MFSNSNWWLIECTFWKQDSGWRQFKNQVVFLSVVTVLKCILGVQVFKGIATTASKFAKFNISVYNGCLAVFSF